MGEQSFLGSLLGFGTPLLEKLFHFKIQVSVSLSFVAKLWHCLSFSNEELPRQAVGLFLLCSVLKGFNSSQVGSLAGAAHLLHANAGVLRVTPQEQKSCLEYKGKSYLDQFIQ